MSDEDQQSQRSNSAVPTAPAANQAHSSGSNGFLTDTSFLQKVLLVVVGGAVTMVVQSLLQTADLRAENRRLSLNLASTSSALDGALEQVVDLDARLGVAAIYGDVDRYVRFTAGEEGREACLGEYSVRFDGVVGPRGSGEARVVIRHKEGAEQPLLVPLLDGSRVETCIDYRRVLIAVEDDSERRVAVGVGRKASADCGRPVGESAPGLRDPGFRRP